MTLSASCVPSRTTGVAPLAVLFDCTGTTTDQTATPFHDVEYTYDFGDTTSYRWQATDGSGAWSNSWGDSWWDSWGLTAQNKNVARGPVAVHVFESASTYTVSTVIWDGVTAALVTNSITVSDPATVFAGVSTICISASSVPVAGSGGAPAGCSTAQVSSWPLIVSSHALAGRRVLLNRSEIYTGTAGADLNKGTDAIGSIIGAYGTGAKPIIRTTVTTNNADLLGMGNGDTSDDVRLMDLDFDGESDIHRNGFRAIGAYVALTKLLLLRCDFHDLGAGFMVSVGTTTSSRPDQIYFVDSTVQRITTSSGTGGEYAVFIGGDNQVVLGAYIDDTVGSTAQHLLRINAADRGVFGHNILKNSAANKEMLALRAPVSSGTGPFPSGYATRYCVVSKNQVETNTFCGIMPDAEASDVGPGNVQDIIVEGNYFKRTTGGITDVRMRGVRLTARNNISNMDGSASGVLPYDVRGSGDQSSLTVDAWIYNNSVYSSTSTGAARFVSINDINVSGLIVRNNVMYVPNNGGTPVAVGDLSTGNSYISSNNIVSKSTDPLFAVGAPRIPTDFYLTSTSPCISSGMLTTLFYDFFEQYRSRASFDIGAYAWQTATPPAPTALIPRLLFMYPKLDGVGSDGIFIGNSVR